MKRVATTNTIAFIFCLAIPLIAGGVAGIAISNHIRDWYANINKPFFNPPNWIFGPVWTILYILMGISLFLIWKSSPDENRKNAILIFFIQLVLNFIWSFLFFQFELIFVAFIEIILIWVFILLMIMTFLKVNKTAAFLQIPYLLWVTFASLLNGAVFFLNK